MKDTIIKIKDHKVTRINNLLKTLQSDIQSELKDITTDNLDDIENGLMLLIRYNFLATQNNK